MDTELNTHIQHELDALTGIPHAEKNMKRMRAYNYQRDRRGLPRLNEVEHMCRLHGFNDALAAVMRMNKRENSHA